MLGFCMAQAANSLRAHHTCTLKAYFSRENRQADRQKRISPPSGMPRTVCRLIAQGNVEVVLGHSRLHRCSSIANILVSITKVHISSGASRSKLVSIRTFEMQCKACRRRRCGWGKGVSQKPDRFEVQVWPIHYTWLVHHLHGSSNSVPLTFR